MLCRLLHVTCTVVDVVTWNVKCTVVEVIACNVKCCAGCHMSRVRLWRWFCVLSTPVEMITYHVCGCGGNQDYGCGGDRGSKAWLWRWLYACKYTVYAPYVHGYTHSYVHFAGMSLSRNLRKQTKHSTHALRLSRLLEGRHYLQDPGKCVYACMCMYVCAHARV